MKRINKLELNKETIRLLNSEDLSSAMGGVERTPPIYYSLGLVPCPKPTQTCPPIA